MSDEWQTYQNDTRTPCKYGKNCYQRNPQHHQNYKHPPKNSKRENVNHEPNNKRFKPTTSPRRGLQDTNKDLDHEDTKDKRGIDKHCNTRSNEDKASTSKTNASEGSCDDSIVIKFPETLSYHNKDDHNLFKELFLVRMPEDFFQFYKCLEELESFEKVLSSVNLELIGPYDLLLGKLPIFDDKELYLVHWRFFYDPPEFQAVLKKIGKSEYHIGYFRDQPNTPPQFLASCDSSKDCYITPVAKNIFATIYLYLQSEKNTSPFISIACQKLMDKIKKWAESFGYSLEKFDIKERQATIQTKTFHGAGIVVPYDKKTQVGYRNLVETDGNLKKMFSKFKLAKTQKEKDNILSDLQPVITYANIAVDEFDFGTGLEAGINLFCSGIRELQSSALNSLQAAYSLLKRDAFGKILQAHLKYRRKGPNMSVLSLSEK